MYRYLLETGRAPGGALFVPRVNNLSIFKYGLLGDSTYNISKTKLSGYTQDVLMFIII